MATLRCKNKHFPCGGTILFREKLENACLGAVRIVSAVHSTQVVGLFGGTWPGPDKVSGLESVTRPSLGLEQVNIRGESIHKGSA